MLFLASALIFPTLHANATPKLLESHRQEAQQQTVIADEHEREQQRQAAEVHVSQYRSKRSVESGDDHLRSKDASSREPKRRPIKRRRKSHVAPFEFSEEVLEQLKPSRTPTSVMLPACALKEQTTAVIASTSIASIVTIFKLPRLSQTPILTQPQLLHSSALSAGSPSLYRDLRECIPKFRPVTYRFIKCLNRALGLRPVKNPEVSCRLLFQGKIKNKKIEG